MTVQQQKKTLVVHRSAFHNQEYPNGSKRGTPESIFFEHGAQVNLTQHPANEVIKPHYHTVDEILYLVDGELALTGGAVMPKGSVILFGANTTYGFSVGKSGVTWLALRPTRPAVDNVEKGDSLYGEPPAGSARRSAAVSGNEIAARRWEEAGQGRQERRVVEGAGSPRISFVRMASRAVAVSGAAKGHRFFYVLEGRLRVDGKVHGAETAVSVPTGVAVGVAPAGASVTYLSIEMPPAAQ